MSVRKGCDLTHRLAYTKPDLLRVLPFGNTRLGEMLASGEFPQGARPIKKGHRIWSRKIVEDWLDKLMAPEAAP
jgi:hypothetical protein